MNYENKYYINTTPNADEPTWAWLAPGITNVTPSTNDVLSEDNYMDGEGFGETEVTGVKPSWALNGHRKIGDPAQDFIESIMLEKGDKRRSDVKWEKADGRVLIWPVTVVNPVVSGGDAQAKETFSAELRANGKPTSDTAAAA